MNTVVADIETPVKKTNALVDGFTRLDTGRKIGLGVGILALIGVLLAAFFMNRQADWRVLYANLSDKDGGAVLAQLSQMNIPYKHAEGGSAILVPADKVHDTRLRLASQGLPKGSTVGYELMDTTRLGMTQFQERLTFQRGLEGELIRSITALSSVMDARVHLALPNQNGFFREQQKPSASVLLTLHPGRTLDRAQVAGIVHLVASSVPELSPKAVSVVDQSGALLSQSPDGQKGSIDSQQLEYVQQLEQMYTRRIMDLLEPIVGRENVRAQVTADVDFSLTEQTSEQHRPNQGNEPSTVRSKQLVESNAASNGLTTPGEPGAVSNQPPGSTTAPINGTAAKVGVNPGAGSASEASNMRREQVINYEVDRTVRVTKNSTGSIRRLTAAIVVNHRAGTDNRGAQTSTPLPPEQLQQMTALVREAIGFNGERGDSVNLMNAPFTKVQTETPGISWWKEPLTQDIAQQMVWPVGMLVLGLILYFGLVRPALKLIQSPPPPINTTIGDDLERPGLMLPGGKPLPDEETQLTDAKRLAKENPGAVANIIKGWVSGESLPSLPET